ncbi:hypothetical protein CJ030_MR0G001897 [Morella rubra]|uniref:Malectin-like domain-containing protein n=1 Tax=Morella rubra TaxID=262757 RepID=A0A6A1UMZ9_9ROSI|nr:hypothetical protein CJ030_MR0G001897 [Morella rubra]
MPLHDELFSFTYITPSICRYASKVHFRSVRFQLREDRTKVKLSMEKLAHFSVVFFPLFVLQFPSLLLLSSANKSTVPTKYLINCGSKSNITVRGWNFVGDLNPGSFSVGPSSTIRVTNSSTHTSLYRSARFFIQPSSVEYDIDYYGFYYVRLHFSPFISGSIDLADALFHVSANNFSLLSNFGVKNNGDSRPVIKEYLLTIKEPKFSVHFTPGSKSFGFINAIEVLPVPDQDFVMNNETGVTPAGSSGRSVYGLQSQAFHTIHRVNIGGTLAYNVNGANNYSASDLVYKTCKALYLNHSVGSESSSNITWRFDVSKGARHLVRLHFCEVVIRKAYAIKFNLYIYSKFSQTIDPYLLYDTSAAPFYWDFVVDSDDSGYMDITVGPRHDSRNKVAFLNGVEIMEFTDPANSITNREEKNGEEIMEFTKPMNSMIGVLCGRQGRATLLLDFGL